MLCYWQIEWIIGPIVEGTTGKSMVLCGPCMEMKDSQAISSGPIDANEGYVFYVSANFGTSIHMIFPFYFFTFDLHILLQSCLKHHGMLRL